MAKTKGNRYRCEEFIGKVLHIDNVGHQYMYVGRSPEGFTFQIIPNGNLITVDYYTFSDYVHEYLANTKL